MNTRRGRSGRAGGWRFRTRVGRRGCWAERAAWGHVGACRRGRSAHVVPQLPCPATSAGSNRGRLERSDSVHAMRSFQHGACSQVVTRACAAAAVTPPLRVPPGPSPLGEGRRRLGRPCFVSNGVPQRYTQIRFLVHCEPTVLPLHAWARGLCASSMASVALCCNCPEFSLCLGLGGRLHFV